MPLDSAWSVQVASCESGAPVDRVWLIYLFPYRRLNDARPGVPNHLVRYVGRFEVLNVLRR